MSVFLMALAVPAFGDGSDNIQNGFAVGLRQHTQHSTFTNYPYGNGDLSCGIAYEVRDPSGSWQLGLNYTPSVSGRTNETTAGVKSILTPQMNLLMEMNRVHAGVGILRDYLQTDEGNRWGAVYWQVSAGLGFRLSKKFNVEVQALYAFDKWNNIRKLEVGDLEYGAWLTYYF